ncbi:MAG: hypothetical protein GX308_08525 [Epulopiscium sp.]|nr:hypothetical protein [Candidatus Epulonipiscium sp.]
MRKYLYFIVFTFMILFCTSEARANTTNAKEYSIVEEDGTLDLEVIKITAGITKDKEVTFDEVRNISGKSKEGTIITFSVYKNESDEEKVVFSQSVGASELFNQLVELKEGRNYIKITVRQEDKVEVFIFQIDRKNKEIKKKLEDIKINNILSNDINPVF